MSTGPCVVPGSTAPRNLNAGWSAIATIANAATEPSCQGCIMSIQNGGDCYHSVRAETKQCFWLFMRRAAVLWERRWSDTQRSPFSSDCSVSRAVTPALGAANRSSAPGVSLGSRVARSLLDISISGHCGRCSNPSDQAASRDFLAFVETAPLLSAQAIARAAKLFRMI